MARFVAARINDVPTGGSLRVDVKGRPIVIFEQRSEYFALLDRCPHEGASLQAGARVGCPVAAKPGEVQLTRQNEIVRCPWHGWEFDIKSGRSVCEPNSIFVKTFKVQVMDGAKLTEESIAGASAPLASGQKYIVIDL